MLELYSPYTPADNPRKQWCHDRQSAAGLFSPKLGYSTSLYITIQFVDRLISAIVEYIFKISFPPKCPRVRSSYFELPNECSRARTNPLRAKTGWSITFPPIPVSYCRISIYITINIGLKYHIKNTNISSIF